MTVACQFLDGPAHFANNSVEIILVHVRLASSRDSWNFCFLMFFLIVCSSTAVFAKNTSYM